MSDRLEIRITVVEQDDELQVRCTAVGALPPAVLVQAIPAIEDGFHKVINGMERQFIDQSMKKIFERLPPELAAALQSKIERCDDDGDEEIRAVIMKIMDCDGKCEKCKKHDPKNVIGAVRDGKRETAIVFGEEDPEKMKKFREENR